MFEIKEENLEELTDAEFYGGLYVNSFGETWNTGYIAPITAGIRDIPRHWDIQTPEFNREDNLKEV